LSRGGVFLTRRESELVVTNQNREQNNNYKHGRYVRVSANCEYCNSKTSKLKCSKVSFCNSNCKNLWQKDGLKGKNNPNFNKKHPHMNIGRKYSDDTRLKLRNAQIKNVERQFFDGMPLMPCIGKQEKPILDTLEKTFGYTILRQHKVNGYFLDGYCPALNLAIEIDEPRHKEKLQQDKYREQQIKNEIGCSFLRLDVI